MVLFSGLLDFRFVTCMVLGFRFVIQSLLAHFKDHFTRFLV